MPDAATDQNSAGTTQQLGDLRVDVVAGHFRRHPQCVPNGTMIAGTVTDNADAVNSQQRSPTGLAIMELIRQLIKGHLSRLTLGAELLQQGSDRKSTRLNSSHT